ncbi:MAG: YkgJ family cysteine cluster protein [Planctomycetaceae bacterium]
MDASSNLLALRFSTEEERGLPPAERARAAFARLDAVAAASPERPRRACASRCTACCHLRVLVGPVETAALAEMLRALPGREAILARVRDNSLRAGGLGAAQHHRARIPCALLTSDGLCALYEVRPLACRAHTSSSLPACERVLAGAAAASEVPGEGWLRLAAESIREGLGEGPGRELHAALAGSL